LQSLSLCFAKVEDSSFAESTYPSRLAPTRIEVDSPEALLGDRAKGSRMPYGTQSFIQNPFNLVWLVEMQIPCSFELQASDTILVSKCYRFSVLS
jgi:hypothetical protein